MDANSLLFGGIVCATNTWTPIDIREVDQAAISYLTKVWHKKYQAICQHYSECGKPDDAPEWTKWKPFEWSQKREDGKTCYAAWDGGSLVGFLNLRVPLLSHFCKDSQVVYIEHVCTAPGNKSTPIWDKRLADIGSSLFAFAVHKSVESGHDGRVGLHAATEAIGFYDKIAEDAQLDLFHPPQSGVSGLHKSNDSQLYYETKAENAKAFLEAFR